MPPGPPRGSGLWPSVLQGTCLLTSQCPSTSKANENPDRALQVSIAYKGDDHSASVNNQDAREVMARSRRIFAGPSGLLQPMFGN